MSKAPFLKTDSCRVAESVERDFKERIEERLREKRTIKPGENCGRHLRMRTLDNGTQVIQYCRKWECELCAAQMIRILIERVSLAFLRHNLTRFATLTLDPKKIPEDENPPEYLMSCWSRFRKKLWRKMPELSWFWVLDVGKSDRHFHLHVLFNEFIHWKSLKGMWESAGGGKITDIRKADELHNFVPLYMFDCFGTQRDPVFVAQANGWKAKRRYDCSESLEAIMRGEKCLVNVQRLNNSGL